MDRNTAYARTWMFAGLLIFSGCDALKTDSSRFLDPSKLIKAPDASQINPILSSASAADTTYEVAPNSTPPTPADWEYSERDYLIGANDILDISVMDLYAEGLETIVRRQVSISGYIDLPLLPRNIKADGLTATQLKEQIIQAYSPEILRAPVISVMVVVPRQNVFSVLGAVARPSSYNITRKEMRLLEALATAGGVTQTNIRYIYVFRQPSARPAPEAPPPPPATGPGPIELPQLPAVPAEPSTAPSGIEAEFQEIGRPAVTRFSETAEPAAMPAANDAAPLRTRGFIYSGNQHIMLEQDGSQLDGQCEQPEEMVFQREPNVYDPFGWEIPGVAEGSRIIAINLKRLQEGDPRMNIVIRENDVVYVPALEVGEFYIGGEVLRPGVYVLTGRRVTVKMALVAAGGASPLGWPNNSILIRRIGDTQEQIIPLDVEAIFRGHAPDLFLKPDDVVAIGSNFKASFYAVIRNAFRMTYGFGFIYDRNFANPYTPTLDSRRFSRW